MRGMWISRFVGLCWGTHPQLSPMSQVSETIATMKTGQWRLNAISHGKARWYVNQIISSWYMTPCIYLVSLCCKACLTQLGEHFFGNTCCCCSQDIKLHIKPMPKKLAFVPAIITKLVSNSIMFSVSIIRHPLPCFGACSGSPYMTVQYALTHCHWPVVHLLARRPATPPASPPPLLVPPPPPPACPSHPPNPPSPAPSSSCPLPLTQQVQLQMPHAHK